MRYCAFISYNHRDRRAAAWLHRAVETYRIPSRLVGRQTELGVLERRLGPVFQDRQELATSGDLAESVRAALEESATLIVVCSPAAAASRWVNEEIRTFTALGRRHRILCLIVGGEPNASRIPGADAAQECLPPALFEHGAREPLAADIRPGKDDHVSAKLKLLAGLLGVGYDELRQRDAARRHRRLAALASASAVGFVAMAALAAVAVMSRDEAVRQRDIARQKTLTAERTVSFVKSLFQVADPSESRGDTLTARQILDRGATELEQSLTDEPTVKAELNSTLGEVYGGLGMYRTAEATLRRGLALPKVESSTRARQYMVLGEAQWRSGDYKGALASQQTALALTPRGDSEDKLQVARILLGIADAQTRLEDYPAAQRNAQAGFALTVAALPHDRPEVALAYERVADSHFYAGDLAVARANLQQALDIRLKAQGESHPLVADDLNSLAAIAYMNHDNAAAEPYFRRALKSYEAVLGPDHPNIAGELNNLARILLERREFAEARTLLQRAVKIDLAQKGEMVDDMVFQYSNLGIAERGLGHDAEADRLFAKAERAARINHHRNLAPILVERAELACASGRAAAGLQLADEAAPIMAKAYGKDPWRTAWVEVVRGACLVRAGERSRGVALVKANAPVIRKRWSDASLYGARLANYLRL